MIASGASAVTSVVRPSSSFFVRYVFFAITRFRLLTEFSPRT